MLVTPDKAPAPLKTGDIVSYKGRKAYKVHTLWPERKGPPPWTGPTAEVSIFYTGGNPKYGGTTIPVGRFAWCTERSCWVVLKAGASL